MNNHRACALILLAGIALLPSCGGGGDSPSTPQRTPPDLAGIWAGSWQGTDPLLGTVTGFWEGDVAQTASSVSGFGTLTGDVDCMDGSLSGSSNGTEFSGTLSRTPCQVNAWQLTALSTPDETASGSWSQSSSNASGTFNGMRIAQRDGPRISFVSPPAGVPGTIVTIVGTSFDASSANETATFGNSAGINSWLSASPTALTGRVPAGTATAPISLHTATGTARSAKPFNINVTSPNPVANLSLPVTSRPQAVAFSPDGRKLYVASQGSVTIISAVGEQVIAPSVAVPTTASAVPQGIVASPDGKRVYATAGAAGISAMDAALAQPIAAESIAGFTAGGGAGQSTQALALSPDGSLLYVADNLVGGVVRIVTLAARNYVSSLDFGGSRMPVAVAASPDGVKLYVAVMDPSAVQGDSIEVLDAQNATSTGSIPLGTGAAPTAIAFTPMGSIAFVANRGAHTITALDTSNDTASATISGFHAPTAIAVSPDGAKILVTNAGDATLAVVDASNHTITTIPITVPGATNNRPAGVAISPDGANAYVADALANAVTQIGDSATLTVGLAGSGIGSVTSNPAGILCGTGCQWRFPLGSTVTLYATAGTGSTFESWSGSGCGNGNITVAIPNTTCTATFTNTSSSTGASGGSGCFIATAAFGSPMAHEVTILRRFRDRHLLTSEPGRAFVRFYYAYSPAVAEVIRDRDWLRAAVRGALWPVIFSITEPAAFGGIVVLGLCALGWHRRRRQL